MITVSDAGVQYFRAEGLEFDHLPKRGHAIHNRAQRDRSLVQYVQFSRRMPRSRTTTYASCGPH
ncbi:MAG: hypothetical protein OSA40_13280, partial [Phycisphaerales bacterium]|nr:hypothetical protein [Phycisphaerales bacterium]